MPAITPILTEAERAHAKGQWEEALGGYRKALMILGDGDPSNLASLYANVAEVKLAQGKPREAETSFEKALSAAPTHARSLAALAKMAVDAKEWGRAAQFERRLARTKLDDEARVDALLHVAARYANDAKDPAKAAEVLDEARAVRAKDGRILEAARVVYESLKQWKKLSDVLGSIADAEKLLHDKAQRRFEQADVLLGRLRDEPAGMLALEAALEDDPTHEKAFAAIVAVRTRRQEWRELADVYAKLVDHLVKREDVHRAWEVCKRLGQLRRDKLVDGPGALDAFVATVQLRPKDVETRAALAELYVAKGDRESALAELEAAARYEPTRAETFRRLIDLHRRLGHTDRAWLAAAALEELGGGNVDAQVLAQQFRGEGPRPSAPLGEEGWALVRAPGEDDVVEQVLDAVASIAVATKVDALKAERRLVALDPAKRQPKDSTATVVRTFAWAATVLGVESPDLFAEEATPGVAIHGLSAVQAAQPSTVFGAGEASGRGLAELSFLVARHLVFYRPSYYPLVFYPTLPELTALFLAAVKLARPELPIPTHASAAAAALRSQLAAHVTKEQRAALALAVHRLDARGGKVDLAAWMRGVELTATRMGMLLAGDLAIALDVMRPEKRAVADVSLEDRRADLLAFSASRALHEARMRLGIAARASMPPPPSSARVLG
jgi:tetratricopeptide (TPR) repeat protein